MGWSGLNVSAWLVVALRGAWPAQPVGGAQPARPRRLAQTPPELGVYSPKRHGGAWYCTTRVENAHGTGVREVLYRWHPWFGLDVRVHAAITKSDGVYFRCTLNGAEGARWQELPAWMFDRAACAGS